MAGLGIEPQREYIWACLKRSEVLIGLHQLALCKLSDARIVKDYTSKIMETLALDVDANELIRRYVRTCNPPLNELQDMERYMLATAEGSFADAWSYQRRLPDRNPTRKQLISKLLAWALTRESKLFRDRV